MTVRRISLPVDAVLPAVVDALHRWPGVVLRAPTGAGKTTRVPPALLDAGLAREHAIIMLEPRRLAATTAARRIAAERGGRVGDEVGYQIRFDRRIGPRTRIQVVTEGILTRMLQDDPFLEQIGIVIFDEFHERNLHSDLGLAMTRRVQREARPDLKIVVMSATIDTAPLAEFLDGPVVESEGRLHPVATDYLPFAATGPVERIAASGVEQILDKTAGDVLVFLPGVAEIRRTRQAIASVAERRDLAVMELYGDLPSDQQEAVLRPADRRKVILSTNVAETSVTIEGVTGVVDAGLARVLRFDSAVGLDRLELCRISRASADQRAGRAGRTAAGVCLRLWTEREHAALREREDPEVRRVDLAGPVLQLRAWGETDLRSFPWFESPSPPALDQAEGLLRRLGAIDARCVTELGRGMARFPVHPRLARMLIEGHRLGQPHRAALAAALLSERDPFIRPRQSRAAAHSTDSDVLDRLETLEEFDRTHRRGSAVGELAAGPAQSVLRVCDQLSQLADDACGRTKSRDAAGDEAVLRALLAAFPDRVARRRESNSPRAVMVGGRGVRLWERSAVRNDPLFLCVDIEEQGGNEALVRQASAVDRQWLARELLSEAVDLEFDEARERVIATRRIRYDDLVIEESPTDAADAQAIARVLCHAASTRLDRALPLDDPAAAQWLGRVRCLRQWAPALNLPAFTDDELREMLPPLCYGRRSFSELRSAPLVDFLRSALSSAQLSALDRDAPERLAVPSGSRIALRYEVGRPPVLAARIQELFGLVDTPRVAGGRVAVLIHLLAPNMRPQQVTQDLRSFWTNTYPAVRSELRRRYPKHSWPDDPLTAQPERRPARRRS
jgi:ATP-dependent helicase HrpB